MGYTLGRLPTRRTRFSTSIIRLRIVASTSWISTSRIGLWEFFLVSVTYFCAVGVAWPREESHGCLLHLDASLTLHVKPCSRRPRHWKQMSCGLAAAWVHRSSTCSSWRKAARDLRALRFVQEGLLESIFRNRSRIQWQIKAVAIVSVFKII